MVVNKRESSVRDGRPFATSNTQHRRYALAQKSNIILIGMPGAGKSTVGVLLAKAQSLSFVDVDLVIQAAEGARLQELIQSKGTEAFRAIEERCTMSLNPSDSVIAPGGSVVYSEKAMDHLRQQGMIVYLHVSLDEVKQRVGDPDVRGIVYEPGETLDSLYKERLPLYERYADVKVDCTGLNHSAVVQAISKALDDLES